LADSKREQRQFWYIDIEYGKVRLVTGLWCATEGPSKYWWCPEVGVSAAEGYSLFNSQEEATKRLKKEINSRIDHYQNLLDKVIYGDDL
jgi:hypothetical protein